MSGDPASLKEAPPILVFVVPEAVERGFPRQAIASSDSSASSPFEKSETRANGLKMRASGPRRVSIRSNGQRRNFVEIYVQRPVTKTCFLSSWVDMDG